MAASTIAEDLTCPVCLELYTDPKLLPCHHSLCKPCLLALLSKNDNSESSGQLKCPSCRQMFPGKHASDIENLPQNFTLASIVDKYKESMKEEEKFHLCDLCEEGHHNRATKKCIQCRLNYCTTCLEQWHPKRGGLVNHRLVNVMDTYEGRDKKLGSSVITLPGNNAPASPGDDPLAGQMFCISCNEIVIKGDTSSAQKKHENHDTADMLYVFREKKKELKRILASLLDRKQDIEKTHADVASRLKKIRIHVSRKKIGIVHKFEEMAEELDRRKAFAEEGIEKETKIITSSLENCLCQLLDEKDTTEGKCAALSKLSILTEGDASKFFSKFKELQSDVENVNTNYRELAIAAESDTFSSNEQIDQIIADAMQTISLFDKELQVFDQNLFGRDLSATFRYMEIKVTFVQKGGHISADVEWVATRQNDHYEISYFCDPEEIIMQTNVVENRCKLTNLKWKSDYIISVTAYLCDGRAVFDAIDFKTGTQEKCPTWVHMAINVTKFYNTGTISAVVQWLTTHQADHYEVYYFFDSEETVVRRNILENSCTLRNLRWGSTYTITVIAYLPDDKAVFDSTVFKPTPEVKYI